MGTSSSLTDAVRVTHDGLADRLRTARAGAGPDDLRGERERVDDFLAATSKHLHAVDAVLVPAARRCPDGRALVHEQLAATRALEVALAHAKAREYGSTWETGYPRSRVWDDVGRHLADERRHEEVLATRLAESVDDAALEALAEQFRRVEERAPSRPHPYVPHTGLLGRLARRAFGLADAFWDTAENRTVPGPARRPRKRPGLLTQYLLADPRFDEEQPPTREPEQRQR